MRFLLVAVAALLVSSFSWGIDAQHPLNFTPRAYTIDHSTITVSSQTVLTLNSAGSYSEYTFFASSHNYFYRLDGLTTNVTNYGVFVLAGSTHTVKGPHPITLKCPNSTGPADIRKMSITPER